jgi:hypothetical protein
MWTVPVGRAANSRYLTGPDGRAAFFLGYGWVNLVAVPPRGRGYPPGWRGQVFSYREYLWKDARSAAAPGAVAASVLRALDRYAAHGINLSRVWGHWRLGPKPAAGPGPGSPDEEAYVWPATPFGRGRRLRADGWPMADLDTFDPVFWDSLFGYVHACAARDILVELVLWFREWGGGPPGTFAEGDFHPACNEQGVDGHDLTDIFDDGENSRRLRHYQERFVRHLLDQAAARGCRNLIVEVDHETMDGTGSNRYGAAPPERIDAWVRHWVRFIAQYAAPPGVPVLVHHDSWCPVERDYGGCRYPYATDPELTGLLQYVRDANGDQVRAFKPDPRPVVARQLADDRAGLGTGMAGFDKPVFVDDDGSFLATFAPRAFRRAMWESLLGGAASFDTLDGHAEGLVPEFDTLAPRLEVLRTKSHLMRYVRERALPLERMAPDRAAVAGSAASGVTCLAVPGETYACYVPGGGTVAVDLRACDGPVRVEWYDPRRGEFGPALAAAGGRVVECAAPSGEDWVLHIERDER